MNSLLIYSLHKQYYATNNLLFYRPITINKAAIHDLHFITMLSTAKNLNLG